MHLHLHKKQAPPPTILSAIATTPIFKLLIIIYIRLIQQSKMDDC